MAPWRPTLRAVDADAEMVARLRNGDEEAFEALVGRYQQPMLRLARSFVPSQAVAEEAVQDTWLGLVRGIETFEGRSSFKTWLFRILVNRARSAGTKEHPAAPTEASAVSSAITTRLATCKRATRRTKISRTEYISCVIFPGTSSGSGM